MRRLRERGGIDVSDKDSVVLAHQASRELPQRIFPAIRDFGVDRACTVFLARALGDGELGLKAAVELRRREFLPGARGNQILQPQVDAEVTSR